MSLNYNLHHIFNLHSVIPTFYWIICIIITYIGHKHTSENNYRIIYWRTVYSAHTFYYLINEKLHAGADFKINSTSVSEQLLIAKKNVLQ